MVNMVREKVVMELLEMIINTELVKQPTIAVNKHKLTCLSPDNDRTIQTLYFLSHLSIDCHLV